MGVPSFYRWLVKKYPEIVSDASEKNPKSELEEFDNLYLDMNGIIHSSFHPEDDLLIPPSSFKDVFENIFEFVDRLFNIVKPRKLLFLAIDGVAPRAKINQQRARRFKTAKDNENFEEEEEKLRKQFARQGKKVLPRVETQVSDSNIITPGTEFMHLLSKELQCYIKRKMMTSTDDTLWKKIKVILSDSNVPGEGEHKIMAFVRAQRCSEGYDPNTRHCLYGLDADLIMLALATHEVHFAILREDVLFQQERVNYVSKQLEDSASTSRGWFNKIVDEQESMPESGTGNRYAPVKNMHFQFLKIWVLREYLERDMSISNPPENVNIDLERAIDDFIFICFFTGNDFLPHMPTLEIHEGAIDLLMHVYRDKFKNLGGHLVDIQRIEGKKNEFLKLKRVERFILSVGDYEEKIFMKRTEIRDKKIRRALVEQSNDEEEVDHLDCDSLDVSCSSVVADGGFHSETESTGDISELLKNTKELKQRVKDSIRSQSDTFKRGVISDKVKLGSPGFKARYYELKLLAKSPEEIECKRKELVQKYTEGLLWLLKYYFSGVPSWNWYYPYHYGPFASDLKGLAQVEVQFQKGLPLKPYDQLLAVLPPKSVHALPHAYQKLMVDDESDIAHFYPTKFDMDADGKRFMWQAVCKLPFIDEFLLLEKTREVEKELKEYEKVRNISETRDLLFVGSSSDFGKPISEVYKNHSSLVPNDAIKINAEMSNGLNGVMHFCEEENYNDALVLCLFFELPEGCNRNHHLLEGVKIPEKTITEAHIDPTQLWHESSGYNVHRAPVKPNKELDMIHARGGWGRGRGRGRGRGKGRTEQNFSLETGQRVALRSYVQNSGSYFPSTRTYSTSASNLNISLERQCTLSASDHAANSVIQKDAGVAWSSSRGRGRLGNATLQPGSKTTCSSQYGSYPAGPWPNNATFGTSAAGSPPLPMNQSCQATTNLPLSASDHAANSVIQKDAGVAWGISRGRGRLGNATLQPGSRTTCSSQYGSYPAGPWPNNATFGTSAAGSPPLPMNQSRQVTTIQPGKSYAECLGRNFWSTSQNGASSGGGTWRNNTAIGTSSAGLQPNNLTSNTSRVGMPSRQASSGLDWQQNHGGGRFDLKTSSSTWKAGKNN